MGEMNYLIVTNTIKRPLSLVEKSLRASLNQIIKPVKVVLIDQNEPPLGLPPDISNNPIFVRQATQCKSVSAARNGLIIPGGIEWIFFCDDDGYPAEDYSEKLSQLIKSHPDVEIFAGSIMRKDTGDYYTLRQKSGGDLSSFRYTKLLMGSNFVVKSKIFNELGRFDERFGAGSYWGSGEETDFCWKAFFSGVRMKYCEELIVYHVPPFQESVKNGTLKSFRYGVGKGALVWKWLVQKRKPVVFYELFEMFMIPFLQAIRAIVLLKFNLIPSSVAAFAGRLYGLLKAAFTLKNI